MLQSGLPSLDGKLERFATKNYTLESKLTYMCVLLSLIFVDLRPQVEFLPKSSAMRYYLAGTQYFQQTCIVFTNPMYPFLIKKMSFDVKHCKVETVVQSRSAQAAKLKKTYS